MALFRKPMLPLLLLLVLSLEISGFLASYRNILPPNVKKRVLSSLYKVYHPWFSDFRASRCFHKTALDSSSLSEDSSDFGKKYIPDTSREVHQFVNALDSSEECEGIETTVIGFRSADRCRGLFARDSFQPGEYILAIPFSSTLLVHETSSGEEQPSDIQLGFRFWTTFLQANEFGNCDEHLKDRWSTYLDCLPKQNSSQFTPTPEFWTKYALDAIEVPFFIQEMKRRQQDANFTIHQHYPNVSLDMHQQLYNELLFAAWLVRSRGFTTVKACSLSSSNFGNTVARTRTVLIPYMDFINHEPNDSFVNAEIQVVDSKTDEESFFALACKRPIDVDEEILIQYGTGQETTLDLVSKYGFYSTDCSNICDEPFFRDSFDGTDIWTTSIDKDEQLLETQIMSDDMRSSLKLRLHLKRIEERIKRKSMIPAVE
jgi:SET domain